MRARILTTILALAISAGCNRSPTAVSIEQTTFDPSLGVNLAQSTKLPSGLYYRDITEGMKVGGRRQLIIPPPLGYGPNDYGPIPGNSVLVFAVDALRAQ